MSIVPMARRRVATLGCIAALVGVGACGGGGDDPGTPPPTPTIALAASGGVSVVAGQSGTATLTLTRGGNYTGTVALAVTGAPTGATVTFTPTSLATGTATSTLTVATTAQTAPGTYPLVVTASGSGVTSATANVTLTVTAPAATPGFTVALGAPSVSVAAGAPQGGTATLTITRTGGFTGGLTIAASGAPAGLVVEVPTTPVTGNTATITVRPGATLAPGTYPITLRLSGTGVAEQTVPLNVVVTPPVQVGAFTLAVAPATVNVTAGGAAQTATATVTRTGGFAGDVALAATGAPQGLAVTVGTVAGNATTATVNVSAGAGVAAGSYPITLTGTAAGLPNQTATLTVVVAAGGGGGTGSIRYTFCAPDVPIWFAVQSGTGAWTRVTPGANNTFAFDVAGRGGVAYVTRDGGFTDLTVFYGTAAELTAGGSVACGPPARGTKSVTGTVAGAGATDFVSVALGPQFATVFGAPTFRLDSVPDGPLNLLATRASIDLATFGIVQNRIILRRDVNYANGAAIPLLDFNGPEAFAPATANLTIGNLGADSAVVFTSFSSAAFGLEDAFGLGGFSISQGTSPQRYAGLPADRLTANDVQIAGAFAVPRADTSATRGALAFFRTVTDRTVTLGPIPSAAAVSAVANAPTLRLRITMPAQAQYGSAVVTTFDQDARSVTVNVSAGYLGGTPATWDVTIPDLAGAGFDAAWGLQPTQRVRWSISATGGDVGAILGRVPPEGTTLLLGQRTGTFGGGAISASRLPPTVGASPIERFAHDLGARGRRAQRALLRVLR